MRKKLLIVLLSYFCLSAMADEPKTQLMVWQTDGSYVVYSLDEKPITTFANDVLVLTTTKISVEYSMAKISRYTFETATNSIENLQTHRGVTVKQTEDKLIVYNLPKGKKCYVYTIDGKLQYSAKSTGQEQMLIPFGKYGAGAYIIKTDNITYKIMKK